ncbi:MAG: GNAT family N-acetyltransferase [Armatimonadetes bacterium]|nr:GNAT family N-acetyltransferase [Armatimonadota bacterium]
MLSTLELLHYCQRFRDTLFAFCFERSADCEELLIDLRVLHSARIRQVLFCPAGPELVHKLELWNRSGYRFLVIEGTPGHLQTAAFIGRLQTEVSRGRVPVVAIEPFPVRESGDFEVASGVMHCAVALGARKVFFPGREAGLEISGKFRSYPTPAELGDVLNLNLPINVPRPWLRFLVEQQELHRVDLVMIEARRGAIYQEVFTHSGAGTLLTREYPNILRPAMEADVRDIMNLMQPYVSDGSLKTVSEEELLESVRSFIVYTVNGQIVASAAVIEHEDCYELGKLCTLPRYQAQGRARELVRAVLEKARSDKKRAVFALTVNQYVADLFKRLGFQEVERETLPNSWRRSYDLSRASRGYWYSVS